MSAFILTLAVAKQFEECEKRKWTVEREKRSETYKRPSLGLILSFFLLINLLNTLFENWTVEKPSDSSVINFFGLRNIHRLMGRA